MKCSALFSGWGAASTCLAAGRKNRKTGRLPKPAVAPSEPRVSLCNCRNIPPELCPGSFRSRCAEYVKFLAPGGDVFPVESHEQGPIPRFPSDIVRGLGGCRRVQSGEGLVQQHRLPAGAQSPDQGHPPPLAAGKGGNRPVQGFLRKKLSQCRSQRRPILLPRGKAKILHRVQPVEKPVLLEQDAETGPEAGGPEHLAPGEGGWSFRCRWDR